MKQAKKWVKMLISRKYFWKTCKTKMASKFFSRRPGCLVLRFICIIFLRNKSFQTLIRVLIYANKETSLQQYFALKMYTFSYSSYPLYLPFDSSLDRNTILFTIALRGQWSGNSLKLLWSFCEASVKLLSASVKLLSSFCQASAKLLSCFCLVFVYK